MKKLKIYSILLTMTVASSLFYGCKQTTKETVAPSKVGDKSPITITFYNADANPKGTGFSDAVAKKITEKTGVTLKIEAPVGGSNARIPLMIASSDYPDMIYAKGDTNKLVDAGALIKLDDYIKKSPNISSIYGDFFNRLKYSVEDPSIYTLGAYGVGAKLWAPNSMFQIQQAVLKDQGYPKLKTLADFEKAITDYKAKYPTINGQKTIGLSLCADDWRWLITVGNPVGSALGHQDDGEWIVDAKTHVATYKFMATKAREYYKWLNSMNAKGLLDPESFTQKYDAYKSKLATGRVLALTDSPWDFLEPATALVKDNKADRTWAPQPITLDETITNAGMRDVGYSGGWGVGITTAAKNPQRVVDFLEFLSSDEGQVLTHWGIEGVNYTVENGKRVRSEAEQTKKNTDPDYVINSGVGAYSYPFPERGDGLMDKTGSPYTTNTTDSIIKNYNVAEKETLKAYGATMFKDLFPASTDISDYGAAFQTSMPTGSDMEINFKKAEDYCQANVPKAVLASPEKFDAVWDEMQVQLKKIGMEKTAAEYSKLLQDKVKLWEEK
ncbi:ABC transporter substrate-binding protein [Clostridium lacusfryxellense]|uniref:ABC transporter substrate-binding protein n=1 Tax=Clostridium lacusfryxellense TaxID=205328 RepID=UPI001C0D3CCF|nr:ABC transporter substrate-binding protein [Clostridium lacusfryxellense]MBU3112213.1 ABC transporter substrate-binding protein [Clostridium lacusfryxellense]